MSQTEGEDAGSETTEAGSSSTESTFTSESILSAEQSTNENGTVNTSASVQEAAKIKFFRRYIDGRAGRRIIFLWL